MVVIGAKFPLNAVKSVISNLYMLVGILNSLEKAINTKNQPLIDVILSILSEINDTNLITISNFGQIVSNFPADMNIDYLITFGNCVISIVSAPEDSGLQSYDDFLVEIMTSFPKFLALLQESKGDFDEIFGLFSHSWCEICHFRIQTKELYTLYCGCQYDKPCLVAHCDQAASAPVISCVSCQSPIPLKVLEAIMTPDKLQIYQATHIVQRGNLKFGCPNCGEKSAGMESLEIGEKAKIHCEKCGIEFCAITGTMWEEPHDLERCRFDFIQLAISELCQNFPEEMVSQCPECRNIAVREVSETSTKLRCPHCGVWFCCLCSALHEPIAQHNLMWHRPNCERYEAMRHPEDEVEKKGCPMCVKLGRRCDPPARLTRERRFDFGEE